MEKHLNNLRRVSKYELNYSVYLKKAQKAANAQNPSYMIDSLLPFVKLKQIWFLSDREKLNACRGKTAFNQV